MQVEFSIGQRGFDYVQEGPDTIDSRILTALINSGQSSFESKQLIASIAQMTGSNPETAFRKVQELVDRDFLNVSGVQQLVDKGPLMELGRGYHMESFPAWEIPGWDTPLTATERNIHRLGTAPGVPYVEYPDVQIGVDEGSRVQDTTPVPGTGGMERV